MKLYRYVKNPRIEKTNHTAIASDKRLALHRGSRSHPERPERLLSILDNLDSCPSLNVKKLTTVPIATKLAKKVHGEAFVDQVSSLPDIDSVLTGKKPLEHNHVVSYETNDMFWNRYSSDCISHSAGTVSRLVELVIKKKLKTAFAIVRPPGHHAGPNKAEGFCWFNNVAIAAKRALDKGAEKFQKANTHRRRQSFSRVLILDWDVHHGNGTQDIFYSSAEVLYISLHRFGFGFYPGTGKAEEVGVGAGTGFNVNIPWEGIRYGDWEYMAAFEAVVSPIVREFDPDLTLVSSGFDAAMGDQLGQMDLSYAGYGWMTAEVLKWNKNQNCVFALEGGYCIEALTHGVLACVDVLSNFSLNIDQCQAKKPDISILRKAKTGALETLQKVIQIHSKYWTRLSESLSAVEQVLEERKQKFEISQKTKNDVMARKNGVKDISEDDESWMDYFQGVGSLSAQIKELYGEI